MRITLPILVLCTASLTIFGQTNDDDKFKQLKEEFATPNVYRTASGAPGHEYYQQKADYNIDVRLEDEKQKISGSETVTYHNNSPDPLSYLWLQLEQNIRARGSDRELTQTGKISEKESFSTMKRMHTDFDGGFKIEAVTDASGKSIPYTINKTMMRVDLSEPLRPGASYSFKVKWWYNINDRMAIGGRSGYEYFEKDGNYLYTIAQFFPRMAVYNDVEGWQNKQFLGRGEFTLPFGDYRVSITVPSDHIVAGTGELQNSSEVLTSEQRKRMEKARGEFETPVMIVNEKEAIENEGEKEKGAKTWKFEAKNVRDFAFASSRKFIWDAMAVDVNGKKVMAMSFYPKEGNPLWEQYSTKVVAHTIRTYSKHTIDYPYPVAQSIHSKWIGMEYPMICFNGGRPEEDGTYSERTKYGMISVIIHEVGHNFFPMIINSDERQWTWMDEGLNTFVQYLTEQEWEEGYPSRRGPAYKIVPYMKGDKTKISPIMTNSESIHQFGNNAYGKPSTALNILRETVMGRELFDFAFKTYCQRWAFKHPSPEDLFRTLEDASAVDLDWFWRGWFYTTDHVDMGISDVKWFQIDTKDPEVEKPIQKDLQAKKAKFIGDERNKNGDTYLRRDSSLADFYTFYDPLEVTDLDKKDYEKYLSRLDDAEREMLSSDHQYYQVEIERLGGLVMPVILEFVFMDGSREEVRIPAEIWRMGDDKVSKVFIFHDEVIAITLDPWLETADVDMSNNYWPPRTLPTRFELYKSGGRGGDGDNVMRRYKRFREENGDRLQSEPEEVEN